jgi:hypothetical protein
MRAGGAVFLLLSFAALCSAAELEQQTIDAFNHYVRVAQQQMDSTLRPGGPFLWIDRLKDSHRQRLYDQLRNGQVVIQQLQTNDDGRSIDIPDGMVHHWAGIVFVPGVTLETAESVLQDYNEYARIYAPEVRRSKLLGRNGDALKLYLQLYKDSPRRVSFNADFEVVRTAIDSTHATSSSVSTRIAELQDPGNPDGPELALGQGSGYLWRMNDYWRYEQKDGGVYLQVESISLSRDVPAILSWFIDPIIRRIARETIAELLEATRNAMEHPGALSAQSPPATPTSSQ